MLEVLKATLKTGSGSAVSMTFAAITSKIIALVLGTYGIGIYSILVQVSQTSATVGTIGGEPALVQGLSSRRGAEKDDYAASVFWIFMLGTICVCLSILILAEYIAPAVLGDSDASTVGLIRWLTLPIALAIANIYFRGVLNGFRAIGRLAAIQVAIAAVSAILAYPVSLLVDTGYPIAFVVMMSVSYAVGVAAGAYTSLKEGWIRELVESRFKPEVSRSSAKHFFSIATVTMFTGLMATGTMLAVRALIVGHFGLEEAGVFSAAWTIGMTYAMIALASFGTYYLPTLSQTSEDGPRSELMNQVLWVSTLIMVPITVSAILLKPLIVQLLYSGGFTPALDMIRWMLIADYLKAMSWVLAMPMLAYADMRTYFKVETLWYLGFGGMSLAFITGYNSIEGIGFSFLLLYGLYLVYTWRYATKRWRFRISGRLATVWLMGLGLVAAASWRCWHMTEVNSLESLMWIAVSGTFILPLIGDKSRKYILG